MLAGAAFGFVVGIGSTEAGEEERGAFVNGLLPLWRAGCWVPWGIVTGGGVDREGILLLEPLADG